MAGVREAAHVDADLGDDDLRGQVTEAGDGAQQPDRLTERVKSAVHLLVDRGDGSLQGIDLTQVQAQQEAVALGDPAGQESWSCSRRVVAKVEWHPGELYPRVGFLVTNLCRPPERVVAFYNGRGTAKQWIKIL